jgi:hypothetical protein
MDTEWRLMPVTQVIGLMETTQRDPLTMCRQEGSGCSTDASSLPFLLLRLPKTRPCRSSGMCVLVKDAGESVLSPDVKVIQSARICDRLRTWHRGGRAA